MEYCGLCRKPVPSSKDRRLLHGGICDKEVAILNFLISATWPGHSLRSSFELSRERMFICSTCKGTLKRYNDACDKISEFSLQIVSKINICVPSQATSSTCVPQTSSRVCTGEKRSAEAATLDNDEEESVSCNETNSVAAAATPFSPEVSILVKGRDRTRRHLMTPVRKPFALSLSRRSYNACSEKAVNSNSFQEPIIDSLAFKAKKEMECLNSQPSQLKDSPKALEKFSWNLLSLELKETVPTLWSFLESLLPKAKQKFICFLISMLLKMQCKQLCQVQKAVSMLLYGNGVHKQVFHCLQPFMVTLSVSATAQAVKQISDRHDADVISWANDILENREVTSDMLPANSTSPIFFMDENHVFFSSSDDVEVSSDVVSSDGVSSCSNDDSSVGDVSEFTEEDDDDYDLNDFVDIQDDESCGELLCDSICQQVSLPEQSSPLPVDMEQCSAVQNSSPLLVAASNQVINNQTHTTQSASLNVSNNCSGYVIVGDNIDKNIRPSYQRQDRTTQSLHYFHSYAVLNRLDTSGLSDNRPSHITISPEKIIPDFSERQKLLGDFETLVTRILVEHMDEFKAQKCEVQWHVKSDYSEEMASKSRVVPLGLVLKNEAKLKDMTEILDDLSKYVPVHVASRTETIEGKSFDIDDSKLFQILLFGDQLTVARARGAIGLRDDDTDALHRLEGFVPAVADWHARMCLLQAMWKRLYSKKGSRDRGTLYQLKNLLNRTAVKQDPSKAMKATEDFLTVVLFAYIITAAKKLIEERPMHSHQCNDIARQIVSRWVKINLSCDVTDMPPKGTDCSYSIDFITLGLLWHGFHDAVREGDGNRIIRYWRFLLPVFKQCGRRNYAIEAFNLLAQMLLLSPRKVAELKWCRTVNTIGRVGHNIPCDLHMEHLNKRLKFMIGNLESNTMPQCMKSIGMSLGIIAKVCSTFEHEAEVHENKASHTYPKFTKDLKSIVDQLVSDKIFDGQGHLFLSYKKHPLLQTINWSSLTKWVVEKIVDLDL